MSSVDSYVVQSCPQSSDGDHAPSDGELTAMTSFMDTDEEGLAEEYEADGDGDGDGDADVISLYPVSHYPRTSSPHRAETCSFPLDPRSTNSDV